MLASRTFGATSPDPIESVGGGRSDAPVSRAGGLLFVLTVGAARAVKGAVGAMARGPALLLAPPLRLLERGFENLAAAYTRQLKRVLALPLFTVAVVLVLFAGSLMLYPRLGQELVPELVQGEFYVNIELPPGTHLDVTQRRLAALERHAGDLKGIRTIYAIAGGSNEQGGVAGEKRENIGQLTLMLDPPLSRTTEDGMMARLRTVLDRQEDLEYRFGRPSYFSFRTPIEVEIRGHNLSLLDRLADDLAERMRGIRGLADIKSSTEGGNPELQIRFDRERLATLGLSIGDVASVVRTKVQGTVATDIQREDRTIDVRLRAGEEYRDSVRDLRQLTVHRTGGAAILLSSVATVTEVEGPADIRRSEGERVAVLTANLVDRDLASVSDEIAAMLGDEGARRAVGRACAGNPVSLLIPCHRAVREDGGLGGYRWGEKRKRGLIERERARANTTNR